MGCLGLLRPALQRLQHLDASSARQPAVSSRAATHSTRMCCRLAIRRPPIVFGVSSLDRSLMVAQAGQCACRYHATAYESDRNRILAKLSSVLAFPTGPHRAPEKGLFDGRGPSIEQ